MSYEYSQISNFGKGMQLTPNPISYCLRGSVDMEFNHAPLGDLYGPHCKNCQLFMQEYCANKWDGYCEFASKNINKNYPNIAGGCKALFECEQNLTAGEMLIRNTAAQKYIANKNACKKVCKPFDPTVANSPMVCYYTDGCNNNCVLQYEVDPFKIDQDPVMDKILENPRIALTILVNIYNTMKRKGTLQHLKHTKLGGFFRTPSFQQLMSVI